MLMMPYLPDRNWRGSEKYICVHNGAGGLCVLLGVHMKPKELKRLSKDDLLEMMLSLTKENVQLREANLQLRQQLENRSIAVRESGSLAEAALKLNGVFEAAQAACEQYTENIRYRSENQETLCRQMEQQTQEKCDAMLAQAKQEADRILEEARQQIRKQEGTYSWLADLLENENTKDGIQ